MYTYKAIVLRVVDGDTIDCSVQLGFDVTMNLRFRLYGINTPETRGIEREQGLKSKARMQQLLPIGEQVVLTTYKDRKEKYGRYLCEVFADDVSLNGLMIAEGLATPYSGRGKTIK